jgi:hypothetical protein
MASVTVLGQRRTVAELDAAIRQLERARREQLAAAARLAASGGDTAPVRAVLRLTEDYLACLRQSRAVLVWELPRQEDRRGAVPAASLAETGTAGDRPRLLQ